MVLDPLLITHLYSTQQLSEGQEREKEEEKEQESKGCGNVKSQRCKDWSRVILPLLTIEERIDYSWSLN